MGFLAATKAFGVLVPVLLFTRMVVRQALLAMTTTSAVRADDLLPLWMAHLKSSRLPLDSCIL